MKKTDSYRKNRHLFIDRTTARCRARRNADFIAVCQRIVDRNAASGIYVPLRMVLREALSSAAPDYYITYEVALARIYAIAARNGRIGSRPSIRRMQYAEIYRRACRLRETSAFFDTMEKPWPMSCFPVMHQRSLYPTTRPGASSIPVAAHVAGFVCRVPEWFNL